MIKTENKLANILRVIGYITFVIGFLMGGIIGDGLILAIWLSSFFTGICILGFAEIIALLQGVYNNSQKTYKTFEKYIFDQQKLKNKENEEKDL